MDLLDGGCRYVVHGRRRNGKGVPSGDTDHGHGDGENNVSDKGMEMFAVGKVRGRGESNGRIVVVWKERCLVPSRCAYDGKVAEG